EEQEATERLVSAFAVSELF
ncbi:hypothetical protein KFL_009050030, partial [Klebsormidium nitens]